MGSLLRLLTAILLLGILLPAQVRHVRLELEDGRKVSGRVIALDEKQIVVEINGGEVVFTTAQVRSARFEVVAEPEPDPAAVEPQTPVAGSGKTPKNTPPPRPRSEQRKATPGRDLLLYRLEQMDRMYPWLAPSDKIQGISLGVLLLALLALALHLSVKLVATDPPSFARSMGLSSLLLVLVAAEAALVPDGPQAVPLALGVNALLAALGVKAFHRVSLLSACAALLMFAVQVLLGYGVLELIDAMLRSVGHTTY